MKKPSKLIIIEDHTILAETMAALLEQQPHITVTGVFETAGAALEALRKKHADLAIIDYCLPDMNGVEFFRRARKLCPSLKGLFLSMKCDASIIRSALDEGAMGYIPKNSTTRELLAAISQILGGEPYISARLSGALINGYTAPAATAARGNHRLTEEHIAILKLTAKGKSTKEIAELYQVPVHKVKYRFTTIFKTLQVRNRSQAILKALELGYNVCAG